MNGMFENDCLMMEDIMLTSQHSEKFLNEQNYLKESISEYNFDAYNDEMLDYHNKDAKLENDGKNIEDHAITMSTASRTNFDPSYVP